VTAGIPTPPCPNCGANEAHWEPDTLTQKGHFICTDTHVPRSSGWYGGTE
jgi:hypothetical protein